MRAADLEHLAKGLGFGVERARERPACRREPLVLHHQRQPRSRREHVVGGLSHVDVIVRVNEVVDAARAAEPLGRAIRDHLVGVHVVRRAGAGLIDVDHELIEEVAGEDFISRGDDRVGATAIEPLERRDSPRRRRA